MNTFLKKFWDYNLEANDFEIFGITHKMILLFLLIVIVVMYLKREKLKAMPQRPIEILLGIIMITPRIMLYCWYGTYVTSLQEVLPLYLCRITIFCTAYTLLTGRNNLRYITYFWGMLGAVLALVCVDTSGYTFPHIMFISFFVGHGTLLIAVFYFILIKDYLPGDKDFKKIIICNLVYITVACVVNKLVGGNYNYLEFPPSAITLSSEFVNSIFYKLSILGVMLLINGMQYIPIHLKTKKKAIFIE